MRNKFLLSSRSVPETGGGFSPTDFSDLFTWLDPSQTNTITADGSNFVTQIDDLSGNGHHGVIARSLTGATNSFKTGTYNINGLNVLHPTTTTDGMEYAIPNTFSPNGRLHTLFSVHTIPSTITQGGFFGNGNGAWIGLIYQGLTSYSASGIGNFSSEVYLYINNVYFPQNSRLVENITADDLHTYITTVDTSGNYTFAYQFTGDQTVGYNTIGLPSFGISDPNTRVGEIIVYNRILSTAEIDQVNAYLGDKWGIPQSSGTYTFP